MRQFEKSVSVGFQVLWLLILTGGGGSARKQLSCPQRLPGFLITISYIL